MKHEDMITLIGNMFINAYVAGDRKDLESFRFARADRDRMYDEVKKLYEALDVCSETMDDLNREIAQLEKELKEAKEANERKDYIINSTIFTDHSHPFADDVLMDDGGKFSEQVAGPGPATTEASAEAEGEEDPGFQTFCDDLPFPDVEEMAPADEVEGSDE